MEEGIQQHNSHPIFRKYPAVIKFAYLIKHNPFKSLFIFFFVVILFQIMLLPYDNIRQLKTKNAGETAFMREQAAIAKKENREFHKMQYWISLRSIPQDAIDAVIVSEDGTFWSNNGFDWFEFRESIERNFEEGRSVRGASTYHTTTSKEFISFIIKESFAKI